MKDHSRILQQGIQAQSIWRNWNLFFKWIGGVIHQDQEEERYRADDTENISFEFIIFVAIEKKIKRIKNRQQPGPE